MRERTQVEGGEDARVRMVQLKEECEAADKALFLAEDRAKAAWQAYWEARGDFRVGDVVQHPSLRGRGEWVVREMWCTAKGEMQLTVQEVVQGVPKGWRRVGRDGLLRVVRRPE